MPELKQYLIVCPLVFLAGLIDSSAGGGGLISLPAYLATGLPVHLALGTNKLSSVFGTAIASARYLLHRKADLRKALVSILFALLGSALGARAVLFLNPLFLRYGLLGVIPVVAVFLLRKKDFGKENQAEQLSATKFFAYSAVVGLLVGFYDGFFGPGTGTFLALLNTALLRYDLITATGNAKLVNLASNLSAVTTFLLNGQVSLLLGLPAAICGIAGNYVGSGLAIKKGGRMIRPMFIVALTLLMVTILVDLSKGL